MKGIEEQEFDQRIDFSIWKRIIRYAMRHKGIVIGICSIMIVVSAIDIVYPLLSKYAIDNFVEAGRLDGLWVFALVYLGFIAIQSTGVFLFVTGAKRTRLIK